MQLNKEIIFIKKETTASLKLETNVRKFICKAKSNYFNENINYNKHNRKQL